MARFSVGVGDESGAGPSSSSSSSRRKRIRRTNANYVSVSSADEREEEVDDVIHSVYEEESENEEEEDDEEEANIEDESKGENDPKLGTRVSNSSPISVTLTDSDVLDCDICCEPLTIPVFQCENGHIACFACCTKLSNKCPSCSLPIGFNRCRAIEKVIEAVKVSCVNSCYGCSEAIGYNDKSLHEKTCTFSPCKCPHSGCYFINSSQKLYDHFRSAHSQIATSFRYYKELFISLNCYSKSRFLQAKSDGTVFIIHNNSEDNGNILWISCISPSLSTRKFVYELRVKVLDNTLSFTSIAKNMQALGSNQPLSHDCLMVPRGFRSSTTHLQLRFCISPKST